jgi:hypothetical protein
MAAQGDEGMTTVTVTLIVDPCGLTKELVEKVIVNGLPEYVRAGNYELCIEKVTVVKVTEED